MKVQYTRPSADGGGFGMRGNETKVEELPDKNSDGGDTAVPNGAVKIDDTAAVHDWQAVVTNHGMPGGAI